MATRRITGNGTRPTAARPIGGRRGPRVSRLAEVLVFLGVAVALALVSCLPTPADGARSSTTTRTVRVEASDSLWSIARDNAVDGVPTAAAVEEIRRLNGLSASEPLAVGTYVTVPTADRFDAALAQR